MLKTDEQSLKPKFRYLNRGEPMTITFGIKCSNGIVVAADSQSEFERGVDVKRLNANKVRVFDERFIFAGAGAIVHIETLIENVMDFILTQERQQRSYLNKDEVEKVTEQALWALVKHYNVDRADALGIPRGEYFCPVVTFAGGNEINGNIVYYLYFLHSTDGTIEPISDYGAAGSGAAYAELLLKGLYSEAISVDEGIRIAAYVADEVKSIDPHCGGDTQMAILQDIKDKEDSENKKCMQLRVLPKSEIDVILREVKPKLDLVRTELLRKILKGEVDESQIRKIGEST